MIVAIRPCLTALMGLGMAGESALEIFTGVGIMFWLFTYAAVQLACWDLEEQEEILFC